MKTEKRLLIFAEKARQNPRSETLQTDLLKALGCDEFDTPPTVDAIVAVTAKSGKTILIDFRLGDQPAKGHESRVRSAVTLNRADWLFQLQLNSRHLKAFDLNSDSFFLIDLSRLDIPQVKFLSCLEITPTIVTASRHAAEIYNRFKDF